MTFAIGRAPTPWRAAALAATLWAATAGLAIAQPPADPAAPVPFPRGRPPPPGRAAPRPGRFGRPPAGLPTPQPRPGPAAPHTPPGGMNPLLHDAITSVAWLVFAVGIVATGWKVSAEL